MSADWSEIDNKCMAHALKLALTGERHVAPNPMVGCVIVDEAGTIVASGSHQKHGGAHAEVHAYESLKSEDRSRLLEFTWYITLEPCNHTGKTPPCTDLLARCRPKRIVVARLIPTHWFLDPASKNCVHWGCVLTSDACKPRLNGKTDASSLP